MHFVALMRLAFCSSLSVAALFLSSAASPVAAEELTAIAAMPSAPLTAHSSLTPLARAVSRAPLAPTSADDPPALRPVEPPAALHRAAPSSGLALSTCFPARWAYDEGALSLSYGFARHFAVRANLASYKLRPLLMSEASVDGRVRDAGLGLVWYPRRLWSGLALELGAIARSRQSIVVDSFADYEYETSDATIYAGRGLIGWSWDWKPVFVSIAAGLSIGTGRGTEAFSDYYREPFERAFNRRAVDLESYFRFGFFFGV